MAGNNQARNTLGHFLMRFVGLTGLIVAGFGLVGWIASGQSWGWIIAAIGGALLLLGLLYEIVSSLPYLASRRGALVSNVALQILFVVVLLVGVNLFSFFHYQRWDLTRESVFSLPQDIRQQLGQLRDETLIVMLVRHTTFGQTGGKLDSYDAAAEKKVMAKVKDLVEQFQEFGPTFKVVTLDVQDQDYPTALKKLTKNRENLGKAIDQSTENSIFFYANDNVQRLSFSDIYQLDKVASSGANEGKGNLVLHYQGPETFARRILNIDEKQPKVAVAVIHEALGMEGAHESFSMAAARKALETRGIETKDILLKKWTEFAPPTHAVLTRDESEFAILEEQLNELDASIESRQEEIAGLNKVVQQWEKTSLKELNKDWGVVATPLGSQLITREEVAELKERLKREIPVRDLQEGHRQAFIGQLRPQLELRKLLLEQEEAERKRLSSDKKSLNVDNLAELRRIEDMKAKLQRMLTEADLLIVPRMTLFNVASGEYIPNRIHNLDVAQLSAIKEFMKAGKPVLFCLGPENEASRQPFPMEDGKDQIKDLLQELGFRLPAQTVLFDVETKSFAQRRAGLIILGSAVEPPPLNFDWKAGAGQGNILALEEEDWRHPIHSSLRLAARSVGDDKGTEFRLRHPRPVYYKPDEPRKSGREVYFLMTDARSWNEAQPFATEKETPRYDPPKAGEIFQSGDVTQERRGPFPIGVAIETQLPSSWTTGDKETKVRLAVIGHGGVFIGQTLTPVQERLLLDTVNWLLGRDDRLSQEREEYTWSYPRVELTNTAAAFWTWGATLGLPMLFVYLGIVVMMTRWMR